MKNWLRLLERELTISDYLFKVKLAQTGARSGGSENNFGFAIAKMPPSPARKPCICRVILLFSLRRQFRSHLGLGAGDIAVTQSSICVYIITEIRLADGRAYLSLDRSDIAVAYCSVAAGISQKDTHSDGDIVRVRAIVYAKQRDRDSLRWVRRYAIKIYGDRSCATAGSTVNVSRARSDVGTVRSVGIVEGDRARKGEYNLVINSRPSRRLRGNAAFYAGSATEWQRNVKGATGDTSVRLSRNRVNCRHRERISLECRRAPDLPNDEPGSGRNYIASMIR
jgi:hypothetical protein